MIKFYYISALINHRCRVIERYFNPILGDSGCNLLEPGIGFFMFMELTQELVKLLFDYNINGFLTWKTRTSNRVKIGDRCGCFKDNENRYVIRIFGQLIYSSRLIFFWHNGYMPLMVDHKNHITTDDRIENLRAATRNENGMNCSSHKDSTSKYLGVSWNTHSNLWYACLKQNGRRLSIGYFKSETDAALAYNREAVRYFKEFANLNIIYQ